MQQHSTKSTESFPNLFKAWRKRMKFSQLELALTADVSQRHISWLETGRSKPSREMILKLSKALGVPTREQNTLLNSAGFAKIYSQYELEEPAMAQVTQVLQDILAHHEPYPAFVLDKNWCIKMQNSAVDKLFSLIDPSELMWQNIGDTGEKNLALLTIHKHGLRPYIRNWDEVIEPFYQRLRRESFDQADAESIRRFEVLQSHISISNNDQQTSPLLPVLPLELSVDGIVLRLCSVISAFGTAQDITANELKIETFYPADHTSKQILESL